MNVDDRHPGGTPAPARPGRRRDDAGFTLVELLVAAALIATVGTATVTLAVHAQATATSQMAYQNATHIAVQMTEQARLTGGAALLAAPPADSTEDVDGVTFTRRWAVAPCTQAAPDASCTSVVSGVTARLARVTATVDWTEQGRAQTFRTTVIVNAVATDPTFAA
ncbi:MAG TPA: type II secretion system protein [Pilimelia sp.]|nr:type II secretion system protein [Pilimelia sp.]